MAGKLRLELFSGGLECQGRGGEEVSGRKCRPGFVRLKPDNQ